MGRLVVFRKQVIAGAQVQQQELVGHREGEWDCDGTEFAWHCNAKKADVTQSSLLGLHVRNRLAQSLFSRTDQCS